MKGKEKGKGKGNGKEKRKMKGQGTNQQLLVSMLCSKSRCTPCPLCGGLPSVKQDRKGSSE